VVFLESIVGDRIALAYGGEVEHFASVSKMLKKKENLSIYLLSRWLAGYCEEDDECCFVIDPRKEKRKD